MAVVSVRTPSPDHGLSDLNTCNRALLKYIIGKSCNFFRHCTSANDRLWDIRSGTHAE